MAKTPVKPVNSPSVKSLLNASEYCASKRLNKLAALIFVKAMANKFKNIRFTAEEWEAKRKELYSR